MSEELERRVRERTAELEAANQELEAFAGSVSHDLRAPLRHIDGFVNLLRASAGSALPVSARRHLETIAESARQMGRLIDDLLAFSRAGRAELRQERVDLNRLVDDVIRGLEPDIRGRNIVWRRSSLPCLWADASLLRQVFANLVSNAIKYTRPRDCARIEIGCRRKNGTGPVIFVRDNGVGFSMKDAGKLFAAFQRLHGREFFEGTGIGLANVRRVIVRHGGRVWAEGKVNGGATFYFVLPGNNGTSGSIPLSQKPV